MNFNELAQSSYTIPTNVSACRTSSPSPDLAAASHPYTGIQLIVRGLRSTSPSSAKQHLKEILAAIEAQGQPMPDLLITATSDTQSHDYAHISLRGELAKTA